MASCAYCGSTIVFGGKKEGELRFCSEKCHKDGYVLVLSDKVPRPLVEQQAMEVRRGPCPKCKGKGPVDVHTSYRVYSAILYTSWSSRPKICCRSCGVKGQAGDAIISFLFGWWGFPWGIIMTPIQVIRNLYAMVTWSDGNIPSEQLKKMVKINIAASTIERERAQGQYDSGSFEETGSGNTHA